MLDMHSVSNAALAYLGDAVVEVLARARLVREGYATSRSLNAHAQEYVRATVQAEAVERLLPLLDEKEHAVYHRGFNMNHAHPPKSATILEYRKASGFETLFGYLWATGERARAEALFDAAFPEGVTKR